MLSAVPLAVRPRFTVSTVTCRAHHTRWSEPDADKAHRLVLVRRGRFRRRVDGVDTDLDPTMAYLAAPGEEERFAHPAGGDLCTSVTVSPHLWEGPWRGATVYVDARVDLAHRRLLAAARGGDVDYALTEELLRLVASATGHRPGRPPSPADRALVAAAREAIVAGHPDAAGLCSLADLLGASPYRLSRVFSRQMGVSLTRYRNRVRVGRVLRHIEEAGDDLAALAADLGFADQAHLTRTVREHLGHTPTALRRLLVRRARGSAVVGQDDHQVTGSSNTP